MSKASHNTDWTLNFLIVSSKYYIYFVRASTIMTSSSLEE